MRRNGRTGEGSPVRPSTRYPPSGKALLHAETLQPPIWKLKRLTVEVGQFPISTVRAIATLSRDVCTAARRLVYILIRAPLGPTPWRAGRRSAGSRANRRPVSLAASARLAEYRLPSVCARVGEIERRSIVIERVPSAYQANNPRRDAGLDARVTTGINLPEATSGARTRPARR